MIDWNGLLAWSTKHHDGTAASRPEFSPMSKEDAAWLAEAMEKFTFDDANRLHQISELVRKEVQEPQNNLELIDPLEELQELIELHERNSLNLALCGGLGAILKLITSHRESRVRKLCC